jgi:hypothetical protein
MTLLSVCVRAPLNFFLWVRVVPKESRRLVLPITSCYEHDSHKLCSGIKIF